MCGRAPEPLGRCFAELVGRGVLSVNRLQVEEAWADMARGVWLIAVEAQALATALELLSRGQPAESPRGGRRGRGGGGGGLSARSDGGRWRPGRRPTPASRRDLLKGLRATLVSASVMHGRLEVLGPLKLHVHPDVFREATHEELGALLSRHSRRVACEGLESVGEVLDRGGEGEAAKLGQATPTDRRPEPQETEFPKALP